MSRTAERDSNHSFVSTGSISSCSLTTSIFSLLSFLILVFFSTISFSKTKVFSASLIIFSVSTGSFSSVIFFDFCSEFFISTKVTSRSPLETFLPILTLIESTFPSIVDGTSTKGYN